MSDRLVRVLVAASLALSIGLAGTFQSSFAQAAAARPQAAAGGISFKGTGMPLPAQGEAFRFSMCEGRVLRADEVSKPCTRGNADPTWLSGGHNANYVFNTGPTFLPRGVTLDGNGILSGKTSVDLSTVAVHICVLQLNETPSCSDLGFGTQTAKVAPKGSHAPALVGVLGAAVGGGLILGTVAKKYQEAQSSGGSSSGGSSNSCTTSQPSSCTSSSRCSCGYRCVTFDGAGSVGFCSP